MNKKITYLELLEMIRDGKQPRKIKYDNEIYLYEISGYAYLEFGILHYLSKTIINKKDSLLVTEKCIEIIEEGKEFEDIEKIDMVDNGTLGWTSFMLGTNFQILNETINKLINRTDKIVEKLEDL